MGCQGHSYFWVHRVAIPSPPHHPMPKLKGCNSVASSESKAGFGSSRAHLIGVPHYQHKCSNCPWSSHRTWAQLCCWNVPSAFSQLYNLPPTSFCMKTIKVILLEPSWPVVAAAVVAAPSYYWPAATNSMMPATQTPANIATCTGRAWCFCFFAVIASSWPNETEEEEEASATWARYDDDDASALLYVDVGSWYVMIDMIAVAVILVGSAKMFSFIYSTFYVDVSSKFHKKKMQ